jgi:hypothetical protein
MRRLGRPNWERHPAEKGIALMDFEIGSAPHRFVRRSLTFYRNMDQE